MEEGPSPAHRRRAARGNRTRPAVDDWGASEHWDAGRRADANPAAHAEGRRSRQPSVRFSRAAHHQRRRWMAVVLGVVIVALFANLLAGGGTAPSASAARGGGSFLHLRPLAVPALSRLGRNQLAAENVAISRTLAYTPFVRIAGSQHRELALTFDDGPGPYTPDVLSVLQREGVPATFFEVGIAERYFNASTTRIVADGDVVGDHTQDHRPMAELSPSDQRAELLGQIAAIQQYGTPFPRLFRPPYGVWNAATLALLHRYHMLMVLWTVDTDDYLRPGVAAIVHSVLARATPGAIILLHDAGGDRSQTVSALPEIIAGLRARGYLLVTVPQLLLDNPAPADQDFSALELGGG